MEGGRGILTECVMKKCGVCVLGEGWGGLFLFTFDDAHDGFFGVWCIERWRCLLIWERRGRCRQNMYDNYTFDSSICFCELADSLMNHIHQEPSLRPTYPSQSRTQVPKLL